MDKNVRDFNLLFCAIDSDNAEGKLEEIATNFGGTLIKGPDRDIISIENEEFCIAKNERGVILNQEEFDNSYLLGFQAKVRTINGTIFSLEEIYQFYQQDIIGYEPLFNVIIKKFKSGGQPIVLPLKTQDYIEFSKINHFLTNKFYIEKEFEIDQFKYFNKNLTLINLSNLIKKYSNESCPNCNTVMHQSLLEIINSGDYDFICSNCLTKVSLEISYNYLTQKNKINGGN